MTYRKHNIWSELALLIVAVTITTIGLLWTPIIAQAQVSTANTISLEDDQKKIKVRKEEEQQLKMQDKYYKQQAKALAKQYKETAKLVEKQGGDSKPLLDAVAYFEEQAK